MLFNLPFHCVCNISYSKQVKPRKLSSVCRKQTIGSFIGLGILGGSEQAFSCPFSHFFMEERLGAPGVPLLTARCLFDIQFLSAVSPSPSQFPLWILCAQGLALLVSVERRAVRVTSLEWIIITCIGVNFFDPPKAGFACSPNSAPSFRTLEFMAHSAWRPPRRLCIPDWLSLGLVLFPCCRYKHWIRHVLILEGEDTTSSVNNSPPFYESSFVFFLQVVLWRKKKQWTLK